MTDILDTPDLIGTIRFMAYDLSASRETGKMPVLENGELVLENGSPKTQDVEVPILTVSNRAFKVKMALDQEFLLTWTQKLADLMDPDTAIQACSIFTKRSLSLD